MVLRYTHKLKGLEQCWHYYQNGTNFVATGNTLITATKSLPVRCKYTYTGDVCNKALSIPYQPNNSLHTPQKYGQFPQDMLWWIPINTTLSVQTYTSHIFTVNQNDLYTFHSTTTFSRLETDGLVSRLWKQLSQYTYNDAAGDTALWFVTLHTVSTDLVIYCVFLQNYEKSISYCNIYVVSVC